MGWGLPKHWGFIQDLRECEGKTIERVELAKLGFGYTITNAWVVKFTDGSRAFFGERPSGGTALRPDEKWMESSVIFTPQELADLVAERMQKRQEKQLERERLERNQLRALQEKYGQPPR
ncbi:MAG TPA: hypothetical protein VHC20_00850 [Candidatus Paceibacterota bacterium]|nr:hypothetical protein [Candidatus Paceibacterota bacterium]